MDLTDHTDDYHHNESDNLFDEEKEEEFLIDEHQLKKDIEKLKRQLAKQEIVHKKELKILNQTNQKAIDSISKRAEDQIAALRENIREMLEKNWELKETSNLFLKGLEHLKKEGIRVTEEHIWTRKGVHGSLKEKITRLVLDGKRIVSICPMYINSQGDTTEALIVTEHFKKL